LHQSNEALINNKGWDMQKVLGVWHNSKYERFHSLLNVHQGSRSPWGVVQRCDYLTPWLTQVNTAGHGGFKLDKEHNKLMPRDCRRKGGWYEEDCEGAAIFKYLAVLIVEDCFNFSHELVSRYIECTQNKNN
jgi:hypothetical protein